MTDLQDNLRAQILEAARQLPSPTRNQVQKRSALALLGGLIFGGSAFVALPPVQGLRPTSTMALASLLWCILGGIAAVGTLHRASSAWIRRGVLALALIVPWVVFALTQGAGRAAAAHAGCFTTTMAVAFGLAVALLYMRRRSDPAAPTITAAVTATTAASIAALVVHLHCPYADPIHLAVSHALAMWLAVATATLVGRRIIWPSIRP